MRSPRSRRAAVTASTALLLGVSACGTQGPPEVTWYSDGETVVVGPQVYCSTQLTDCEPAGRAAQLSVPPGDVLQVSLPTDIADAPWRMLTAYVDASGTNQVLDRYYAPGERLAVTVGLPEQADVLQFVEIQLPSAGVDADGNQVARATWSVQNSYTPQG